MKRVKTLWRRMLFVAVASAVVIALWRYERRLSVDAFSPIQSTDASTINLQPSPDMATRVAAAAEPGPAERALNIDALRKTLASRTDAEAQIGRIVAFARFRDRVAAYGRDKARMSAAERAQLARQILADLPEHVARNEVLPAQAEVMTAALLGDAEPNPAAREAQLQAAREQWDAYARRTVGPSPARDPRYQAYARQSKAVIDEVQATVSNPQQQQIVIGQRLQALRVQLFDHASSSATH